MLLIKSILGMFMRDVIEDSVRSVAKREAVAQLSESVRVEFLRTVAEGYTREVTHNIGQYVRSVEAMSVVVSSDNTGERLYTALQSSLKNLEVELERQGPDSPVIKYLQERYGGRDDRANAYSVVGLQQRPVYSMLSGYSESAQSDQPWLNRVLKDSPEIGEILATEASRIFGRLFSASPDIASPL